MQRRVEGREEALPLWYAQLRWPLWEPYPMSWERFYQLEHDGPGRGLAGIRAGSLTCTATHRSLSLVRKIVSAGFAMAARPSWDLVQGILASASGSRSCRRRRVLPIGKFTPSASRPPATSWKRILYEFFLAFFVKNSRSYYVSLEYLSLNIALIIFFFFALHDLHVSRCCVQFANFWNFQTSHFQANLSFRREVSVKFCWQEPLVLTS